MGFLLAKFKASDLEIQTQICKPLRILGFQTPEVVKKCLLCTSEGEKNTALNSSQSWENTLFSSQKNIHIQ